MSKEFQAIETTDELSEILLNSENYLHVFTEVCKEPDSTYCEKEITTVKDAIDFMSNECPEYIFHKGKNKIYYENVFIGVYEVK